MYIKSKLISVSVCSVLLLLLLIIIGRIYFLFTGRVFYWATMGIACLSALLNALVIVLNKLYRPLAVALLIIIIVLAFIGFLELGPWSSTF